MLFGSLIVVPGTFLDTSAKSKIYYSTLLLFMYLVISSLASGLSITEYAKYKFIRYDGNIFYSYAPLLLLPFLEGNDFKPLGAIRGFILAYPILIIVLMDILHLPLFTSHNALGGMTMIVFVLNVAFLKNPRMGLALILNSVVLLRSDSRGSMIGALCAVAIYFFEKKQWRKTKAVFILGSIATAIAVFAVGYIVWVGMDKPIRLSMEEIGDLAKVSQVSALNAIIRRGVTISHRIFFIWPVAVDDFLRSPLLGIGFSRFDDLPYHFSQTLGLVSFNTTSAIRHTDLHAHCSYLHFLAETGILGLSLVFFLFKAIFQRASDMIREARLAVSAMTWAVLYASLTEHRLTTPAQMFPYMAILVLIISSRHSYQNSSTLPKELHA